MVSHLKPVRIRQSGRTEIGGVIRTLSWVESPRGALLLAPRRMPARFRVLSLGLCFGSMG